MIAKHAIRIVALTAVLLATVMVLGFQICGQSQAPAEQDYQRFLDAVKRAPQEGWTPSGGGGASRRVSSPSRAPWCL